MALSVSCAPSIAPYSETAYSRAVDLKVESLRLMGKAENSFEDYSKRVGDLDLELEKAYEFARGRPGNTHSTEQWKILNDPENNLLGGFLKRWQASQTLRWPFIEEARRLVAEAFDSIIGLESGKIKTGGQL